VLGYARLLGEDKPADHPDRAGLDLIATEAERMKGIVGGLLDYARRPAAPDEPADVAATLARTAALLGPSARAARVELEVAIAPDLPGTAAPAYALQQVVFNLALNAIQAMPDGGRARLAARADDGAALIEVSDDGPGVPPELRERIFEPFHTSKPGGTGLGLAVCRHLVAGFRGAIAVEAGDGGRGARFRVRLPRAAQKA
jgi:signal transduction histidine kinase